jgi:hypothetical protein
MKARVTLALSPEGDPALVLSDKNGTMRVTLGLATDGKPELVLRDESGDPRWRTPSQRTP